LKQFCVVISATVDAAPLGPPATGGGKMQTVWEGIVVHSTNYCTFSWYIAIINITNVINAGFDLHRWGIKPWKLESEWFNDNICNNKHLFMQYATTASTCLCFYDNCSGFFYMEQPIIFTWKQKQTESGSVALMALWHLLISFCLACKTSI